MLCQSCRRVCLSNIKQIHKRGVATAAATPNAASSQPPTSTPDSKTSATSSATPGISQPLSTPFFPSTSSAKLNPTSTNEKLERKKIAGSITGGSELKGLAYLKAKPVILAKEDDEYPAWLWSLLDNGTQGSGPSVADLAAMTKRQRLRYDRQQERLMKDVAKPIPVHEQSKDLTGPDDDAIISLQRRQEVTKSSRDARRKGIRESNFLKEM